MIYIYIYILNLILCIVMYTVYTIWVRKSARMPDNAIVFRIVDFSKYA